MKHCSSIVFIVCRIWCQIHIHAVLTSDVQGCGTSPANGRGQV